MAKLSILCANKLKHKGGDKMKTKRFFLLGLALAVLFVVTGCGEVKTAATDQELLKEAMDDEYYSEFSNGVMIDEENGSQKMATEITAEAGYPHICDEDLQIMGGCWFRRVHRTSRDLDIHIEGGIATVDVTTTREGKFKIDMNNDHNFGEKEIKDTAKRHATFEKNPSGRWQLKELSPIEINLQDEAARTIKIQNIKVYVNDVLTWEVSDPTHKFSYPDELPHFKPNDVVKVTAKVENKNPDGSDRDSYVYFHHTTKVHRPGIRGHLRDLMYDDGTHGDEIAGDKIFTRTYTHGGVTGWHHAAVDVLDKEMFSDETTQNYNSSAWVIPYKVE